MTGLVGIGYRCSTCTALSESGDECPICHSRKLKACADLADEAIEDTMTRGGQPKIVGEHPEFHRDGGLGGLLRYRAGIQASEVRNQSSEAGAAASVQAAT